MVLSPSPDSGPDIQVHHPTRCGPGERDARVEPAACYRVFAQLGQTGFIYNHTTSYL